MNEIKVSLPDWLNVIAVFDTETTGIRPKTDRVVTAAVHRIDIEGNVLPDGKDFEMNPGMPIPEAAAAVHGFTDAAVANFTPAAEGMVELIASLQELVDAGVPIVAYNASYDFSLIHYEALSLGLTPLDMTNAIVIDPLVLDKTLDKYRKGKRTLQAAAERYGVSLVDAHTAKADAVAAGQVGIAVLKYFMAQGGKVAVFPQSGKELHEMQKGWADEIEKSFAEYMQRERPDYQAVYGWPIKVY